MFWTITTTDKCDAGNLPLHIMTTRNRPEISIVAPVYKCGECVAELHRQLIAALEPLVDSFEIILVNDACPSNSWEAVRAVAAIDPRVKAINLSRNFGQHYAIAAGLHHCSGA
jgi:polyisoprenyl-phosphate glycosyltransferase